MKTKLLFIVVFFIICLFNVSNASQKITSLKEIESNTKKVLKSESNIIVFNDDFIDETFFVPAKKISIDIIYSGIFNENISIKNKEYYKKWKKYFNKKNETTTTTILNSQINLFYEELLVVENGNRIYFIIPKYLSNQMKKELKKNDDISIDFDLLAIKNNTNSNDIYAIITNYEKLEDSQNSIIKNDIKPNGKLESLLKNDNYDSALAYLDSLIKKDKNNILHKKNYCNVWSAKLFKFNAPITKDIINCYVNLKQDDDYEINYTLGMLYFKTNVISPSVKNKFVISYLTKVVNYFSQKNVSILTHNEKEIYYNSLYIRGITKLKEGDKTGQNDLDLCKNRVN